VQPAAVATETVLSHLEANARSRGDAPAYYRKLAGRWQATGWRQYRDQVREAARALAALGVGPGGTVAILGANRPEWTVSALAAMAAGGAPVGVYATSSPRQVGAILRHAGSTAIVVENAGQWEKVREVRGELPALRQVVLMEGEAPAGEAMCLSWQGFLARAAGVAEAALDERLAALAPDQVATLIYTSGTTGEPKGAALSHANLVETARICREVFGEDPEYSLLSYLPLAHIAEQMFSIHAPIVLGYRVYYAEALDKLPENLREVEPTIFFGVPRVWERIHATLRERAAGASWGKRRLFAWALGVGRRAALRAASGGRAGPWAAFQQRLAERLVAAKVRARLGLARVRIPITGGAPIAPDILEFFAALGLPIYEVYGLSEACGPVTWNRPGALRFGTLGTPMPGVEVRIAGDGEILVRGPNVFLGYFQDPAATAEAFDGGWLKTGDLGRLDGENYLTVTGRKKEILITAGGKNIAPVPLERALEGIALVGQAVVVGDRRPYLAALLTLDREAAGRFAAEHGLAVGEVAEEPALLAELQRSIDEVNRQFARVENIRRFRVLPQPFTEAAGELTPTQKIRRQVICRRHAAEIDDLYGA
jgi:long-chain acyl-CoA synthetase